MRRWIKSSDQDTRSLYLLNATQFLGALNDNLFKLLIIYLLIHVEGAAAAPTILSLAGAIFVIPFLLFSSNAGILADRMSKRTLIVFTKVCEIVVMIVGLIAVVFRSKWGCFAALFGMAAQSAVFGPSKYGIIPELVEEKKVAKANGVITSFTYLAIILGTFLASFLTDVTDKNFIFVSLVCVLIAIMGFMTSIGIRKTRVYDAEKKLAPLFLIEIFQTLKFSWTVPHLLVAIFGAAFFLFVGAFTQLNVIPLAMESLHLSEVYGGYLFLPAAIGIVMGATVISRVSKEKIELGISCICGMIMGVLFILLACFASFLWITLILLALIGFCGGAFLVPFDAFLQVHSPDAKRGQVIGTSSFFSFIGVLLASFFLYVISEKLQFNAASGFAFMGILTLIASLVLLGRVSRLFFPFFVHRVWHGMRSLRTMDPLPERGALLVLPEDRWKDIVLMLGISTHMKVLLAGRWFRRFPWFNTWIESMRLVSPDISIHDLEEVLQEETKSLCILVLPKKERVALLQKYTKAAAALKMPVVLAKLEESKTPHRFLGIRYHHVVVSMQLDRS